MWASPKYPLLYQVNTRAMLTDIGRRLGRAATLDDISDAWLDRIAALGFHWVWMLGVWQTGEAGRQISRSRPDWLAEYRQILPDLADDDIAGSCFAVTGYDVHAALGGNAALQRLRNRLADRRLRLMLDFVPNHIAPDHPWVLQHPDWLIRGTEDDLRREPQNWCRIAAGDGSEVFAYGRDPYFAGWPDTLQLNWANAALQKAMLGELLRVASRCDGVRCDMAMLILPEIFLRTWHVEAASFWPEAIATVREQHPKFCFMAEVYWDMEWTLQQQGFDYTYDKRLYDRLCEVDVRGIRDHLSASLDYQDKLARFLENHDEPRAAATFSREQHEAAALVVLFAPGLRLIHQGQMHGRRAHVPTHLRRWPDEPLDDALAAFYQRLLAAVSAMCIHEGNWSQFQPLPAWRSNNSSNGFIAQAWRAQDGQRFLAVVNYAHTDGQCYLRLPFPELAGRRVRFRDTLSDAVYDRSGSTLITTGLYLDLPAWGYHAFALDDTGAENVSNN